MTSRERAKFKERLGGLMGVVHRWMDEYGLAVVGAKNPDKATLQELFDAGFVPSKIVVCDDWVRSHPSSTQSERTAAVLSILGPKFEAR